uniref:H15 domain-containing protein n=1 Tax=Otus sunia TaxID=257818 RepID=A0A8C8B8H7_9STRI
MGRYGISPRRSASKTSAAQLRARRSLSDRILHAVNLSPGRKGASLTFIKNVMSAEGYDVARNKGRLKAAIVAMLENGLLERVTGNGVAGSFRIGPMVKDRLGGAAQRKRATPKTRQRLAGKKKKKGSPRRALKSTAKRRRRARKTRKKVAKRGMGDKKAPRSGPQRVVLNQVRARPRGAASICSEPAKNLQIGFF